LSIVLIKQFALLRNLGLNTLGACKQDNIWAARLGLANEAWQLTSLKLANAQRKFPAFWRPGFYWVPDHNWGGSGMIGL
jgi:hypothetical protein